MPHPVREGSRAQPVQLLLLGQVRGAGEVARGDGARASHLRDCRRHGPARPARDSVEGVHRLRDGGGRTGTVQGALRAPPRAHAARQGVDILRAVRAASDGAQQRRRRRRNARARGGGGEASRRGGGGGGGGPGGGGTATRRTRAGGVRARAQIAEGESAGCEGGAGDAARGVARVRGGRRRRG